MPTEQTLSGRGVTLRPAADADVPALVELLAEPSVTAWWGTTSAEDVRQELHLTLVAEVDGEIAGLLLVHEEDEPDYRHVALDIALATRFPGRGLGPEALRTVIRRFIERGHHRFQIDPTVTNTRAIAAYASLGFKPVGILRAYERDPAGGWRDGLLMDLLADELT